MASAKWFYQVMGEETGPVTSAELKRLATSGTVERDTLIRQGVSGRWTSAEKVTGLFNGDAPEPEPDSHPDPEPSPEQPPSPPSPPKAALASAQSVERRASPPVSPPRSFVQRHPFYGSFVYALEGMAVALIFWGIFAGFKTWQDLKPAPRTEQPIGVSLQTWETANETARSAAWGIFNSCLIVAGGAIVSAMVGRLLLSIEGHVIQGTRAVMLNRSEHDAEPPPS